MTARTGQKPLDGDDARAVIAITWRWIEHANDGYGSDVGDLMYEMEKAGYGPPPAEE